MHPLLWLSRNPGVTMRCEAVDNRGKAWPVDVSYSDGLYHFDDGENQNSLPLAAIMLSFEVRERYENSPTVPMRYGAWGAR